MALDFTVADAALWSRLGAAAVYTPPAGSPTGVTAIVDAGDAPAGLGDGPDVVVPRRFVRIRLAELAAPVRLATLVITATGETLTLGAPELDETGAAWLIGCRA